MKLLLDECVDQRLRTKIPTHDIFTVGYMGWSSAKNGDLLQLAAAAGFAALVTTDRSIQHQHSSATLPLSVVWLEAASNDVEDLIPLIPALLITLKRLHPRTFVTVS